MSLEERLESGLPSAWRPDQEDPDVITGEVIDIQAGTSDYGPYPLLVLRLDDGSEKSVHGFRTVLQNELKKQKPRIGERIGIKYLGEQPTKPGSPYKSFINYRVVVEREAGAFDWSIFGEPDASDPDEIPEREAVTVPAEAGEDNIPF